MCLSQLDRSADVAEPKRVLMAIPILTQEYTPVSCNNSRKIMRLPPHQQMRHHSPAMHAEQIRVPHQTPKETGLPGWNTRESQTTLSQVYRGPEVTAAPRKGSGFCKSTRDESRFPCMCSRAIPNSPSNMRSGLTSFKQQQSIPENTVQSPEEHQVQQSNSLRQNCLVQFPFLEMWIVS